MTEIEKRKLAIFAACAASKYFLNICTEIIFDGDNNDSDDFVHGLLHLKKSVKIRGKLKKRLRIENFVENTVPRLTTKQFQEHFRMSPTAFESLENKLGNRLQRNGETGRVTISVRKQLLATLWLLATPDSYSCISVGMKFDLGKTSHFHCVRRVVKNLSAISSEIIHWPRGEYLLQTKRKFERLSALPNVIGAVDGSFISILAPEADAEMYITRKSTYSIVLQGICNNDLRFTDCFIGYPRSTGNCRIFRNSHIYHAVKTNRKHFFPNDEYIIADKAYPVLNWCLPPYKERGVLTRVQNNLNKHVSKSRQVIEHTFALLKGKFRRLKYLHMTRTDLIPETILACCVLHNVCRDHENDAAIANYILDGQINHNVNNNDEVHDDEENAEDEEGIAKRDYIAHTIRHYN